MGSYERLTLIYDADKGARGGVAYAWGVLRRNEHCSLCEITHGTIRAKPTWETWRCSQPTEVEVIYRNEMSGPVAGVAAGSTPCVVAHTDDGLAVVMPSDELESCGGDVEAFASALDQALERADLHPPADPFSAPSARSATPPRSR